MTQSDPASTPVAASPPERVRGRYRRLALLLTGVVFLWGIARLLHCAAQTAFSHGELARLHAAWLETQGARGGIDYYAAGRPVEIQALALLLRLLGADLATVTRIRVIGLTLFLLALLYLGTLAQRLYDRKAAVFALVSLALTPPLAVVSLRVGLQGLATLCALAVLSALVALGGEPTKPRRPLLVVALGGAVALLLVANAFELIVTIAVLLAATVRDLWSTARRTALALLAIAAGLALECAVLFRLPGEASGVLSFTDLRRIPELVAKRGGVISWLGETLFRNPFVLPLAIAGVVAALMSQQRTERRIALAAGVAIAVELAVRPPDIGVPLGLMLGALLAGGLLSRLLAMRGGTRSTRFIATAFVAAFALLGWTRMPVFDWLLEDANWNQVDGMRRVAQLTSPHEPVFDGYATYLFRPHAYSNWSISTELRRTARVPRDASPAAALRRRRCKLLLRDPAVGALPREENAFLDTYYLPVKDYLWVAGATIKSPGDGTATSVDLIADGTYELHGRRRGLSAQIDGKPLSTGERMQLSAGAHLVKLPPGQKEILLRLAVPPEVLR